MDTATPTSPAPPPPPPPHAIPTPPPPDTARSAALWLGGTGAFLLLVAAAVLVAVRWDDLTALAKLAGLTVANGAVLGAGLRFRGSVPATARALYHLGGLLIPVSTTAVAIQVGLPWSWTLATTSLVTIAAATALDRIEPSPVLAWLGMAAVVPAAGGVAALTGAPAGVVLATAAILAVAAPATPDKWRIAALGWAGAAASLVLSVAIDDPVFATNTMLRDLGLGETVPPWAHLATGLLAGLTFARAAHVHQREPLALLALGSALGGAAGMIVDLRPTAPSALLGVVIVAVALELAALAGPKDGIWSPILRLTALGAEVALGAATLALVGEGVDAVTLERVSPTAWAPTAVLVVVGWLAADQRRREPDCQTPGMALLLGSGFIPATVGAATAAVALTAVTTASGTAVAWTAAGVAIVAIGAARGGAHAMAPVLLTLGLVAVAGHVQTVVFAGVSAVVMAAAASLRNGPRPDLGAPFLLATAVAFAATGSLVAADMSAVSDTAALAGFVAVTGLLTVLAERASTDPIGDGTGLVGRLAMTVPFVSVSLGTPWAASLVAGCLALGLIAVDGARSRDRRLLLPALVTGPAVVVGLLDLGGLTGPEIGVGLAVLATGGLGAILAVDRIPRELSAGPAALAAAGLMYATPSPAHLSTVALVLGGAILLAAADRMSTELFVAGAAVTTAGFWTRLGIEDVTWSEAYLAPVAATLVLVGALDRGRLGSSWWTHGVAVGLITGAGFIERVAGGSGGHALLAGAVATLAIAAGAHQRLIGPLAMGTLAVVAIAGHESLAYTASVPTWAWLAAAGTTLLGCGVVIERRATSPLETGRAMAATIRAGYR